MRHLHNAVSHLMLRGFRKGLCDTAMLTLLIIITNYYHFPDFLADRTNDRAYATALRPSLCRL